ncbi:MAG TPA: hypothetical protein VF128_16150 [Gemmatimonadaceae bacterium]
MNTDNERAAAAEATLDYVVALSKHGIDMPPLRYQHTFADAPRS